MNDIYRICILIGALGIALIYGSSIYIEPEKVNISEIEPSWSGKRVVISGEATGVSKVNESLFFDLNDSTGEVMVADFDSESKIEDGKEVRVQGRVTMYRGKLEIVAERIEK